MSAHHRTGREDGLSLVEMMIALLIVGLVLAALASSLVTALRAVRGQESTTQATAAINDILEEAQRVDYAGAALCDTTGEAVFGDTVFEGEPLVLTPSVCGAPDEVEPERTVTIPPAGGREYKITTAITWADDDADGTGNADVDSTQDIKRIVVDVTWTSDGRARTARNIAFRAPQSVKQLLTAEVAAAGEFVRITDGSVDGENAEAFTLRAFAREKLSSVTVSWIDRTGATESHTMVEKSSNVWEYKLDPNFGPFANGGNLFNFDATAATGETLKVAARGLFLYDMVVLADDAGNQVQRNFAKIIVGADDGAVCPGQALWVDVQGAIRSDVTEAVWLKGPTGSDTMSSVDAPGDVALRGARFLLDLSDRTDFSTYDSSTDTYTVPNTNQVRVSVRRIVDSATIAKELDSIPMETVSTC